MNVVGLDLSLTGTGVARTDGTTLTLSSIHRGIGRVMDLRAQLRDEVRSLHREHCADLVVIEGYAFGAARGSHAHDIGELGGAIKVWLTETEIAWTTAPPASVKKFACNKGNANKTDMALAGYKSAGLEFADDNCCDAWWLRQIGLYRFGGADVGQTAYRDEAVSKVDWPALAVPA